MLLSVIIITLNRPECMRRCLDCLRQQQLRPAQIIVVDASTDDATARMVEEFPEATYLRNDNGFGRMTASRNIGLLHATGDVVAFVDDDAFAEPGWVAGILNGYTDAGIGAVGGRALNRQPDEAEIGKDRIGKVLPNGTHTGYHAADPGRIVEVDHLMGCNMSFRRSVLAELGGFREDYPGISGVREDTDMSLRVAALGYKLVFNPVAVVDHIGAPQAVGKRFDYRYAYYSARNHVVMLGRNYGWNSSRFARYLVWHTWQAGKEFVRRIGSAVVRLLAVLVGLLMGLVSLFGILARTGRDPVRRDTEAEKIRAYLRWVNDVGPVPNEAERQALE